MNPVYIKSTDADRISLRRSGRLKHFYLPGILEAQKQRIIIPSSRLIDLWNDYFGDQEACFKQ